MGDKMLDSLINKLTIKKPKSEARDNVKYEENEMAKKFQSEKEALSPEKVSIANIRKNQKGLYFDLRIEGEKPKTLKNLLIPKRFYEETKKTESIIKIEGKSKLLMFKYLLVYCAAVLSVLVIIDGFMRFLPFLRQKFGF